VQGEESPEASDIGENLRSGGGLDQRFDHLNKTIAGIDVDAGILIGNFAVFAQWF
jgi:hypothetical protein